MVPLVVTTKARPVAYNVAMPDKLIPPIRSSIRFMYRTPLLPFATYAEWSSIGDIQALRDRLAAHFSTPLARDAVFIASPELAGAVDRHTHADAILSE